MKEKVKINIVDKNGNTKEATILLYFKLTDIDKEYVVYTYGEIDDNNLETIYTSTLIDEFGTKKFGAIETDEEWQRIKDVMRDVIKSNKE